jgi:acetoin utilization protein AcuB
MSHSSALNDPLAPSALAEGGTIRASLFPDRRSDRIGGADVDASVKSWMSGSPVSIEPHSSALEAHELMVEFGIRHLPVVDPGYQVVGVLSIDDLRAALPAVLSPRTPIPPEGRDFALECRVGDIMTHAPHTLRDGASMREAADRMADHRIGCLPVVDDEGRLTGILSETDALRALAAVLWPSERAEQRAREAEAQTLAEDLRQERQRIVSRLDALREGEREISTDLVGQPVDPSDAGAALRQLRLAEGLEEMTVRRLDAIDRALDHAAQGRLSICDRCGGRIPLTRLRAVPGTTLCVACAREAEVGRELESPFDRPPGGRAETGRPGLGSRVYTRRFGEGVLVRISPFGTCPQCGDVEGERDRDEELAVCGSPDCGRPLEDVNERATVRIDEREAYVDPAEIRSVDPAPYD